MADSELFSSDHEHNRRAWDSRVRERKRFTEPLEDGELRDPQRLADVVNWLGCELRGRRVLCLAAGGGRHGVLYAAADADVTVVDISEEMLRLDRQVAKARGLDVHTVQASMDRMPMFREGQFDIVVQPVSTCYVPDICRVYSEVARVLVDGGLYTAQHKAPASLQADVRPTEQGYLLSETYYRSGPLSPVHGSVHREEGTREYLHRWEQLIGGLCRSGFVIEDLVEPMHADRQADRGSFAHRSLYVAPYIRIKARRTGRSGTRPGQPAVWLP